MIEQLKISIDESRKLARGLSPVALGEYGLINAVNELTDLYSSMYNIDCEVYSECEAYHITNNVATQVFRIIQEAMNNSVKHSGGKNLNIVFSVNSDSSHKVEIIDNGKGFKTGAVENPGMGLSILKFRGQLIDSIVEIKSTIGSGTTITCKFR